MGGRLSEKIPQTRRGSSPGRRARKGITPKDGKQTGKINEKNLRRLLGMAAEKSRP